jgi:tRNA(fMet)-specific endonuclease VapC
MVLLDTNVCVEFLRGRNAGVVGQLQRRRADDVRICSVVLAELYFGALRSAQPTANLQRIAEFAQAFVSVPFDNQAAEVHATIRSKLIAAGTPIGPHDCMIAAIALANACTLVTHNINEFSRIPGLVIEDWQS